MLLSNDRMHDKVVRKAAGARELSLNSKDTAAPRLNVQRISNDFLWAIVSLPSDTVSGLYVRKMLPAAFMTQCPRDPCVWSRRYDCGNHE